MQPPRSSSRPTKTKKTGLRRDTRSTLVFASDPTSFKSSLRTDPSKYVLCSLFRCSPITKFKSCLVDERYNFMCTHRLNMVRFGGGHMSFKCPFSCSICKRRHHALLNRELKPTASNPPAAMLGRQQSPTVLLGTALVHLRDTVGGCQTIRALIDSASQISTITSTCCKRLGLKPSRWTVPVTRLSSQKVPDVQGIVQLTNQPRGNFTPSIKVKP